MDRIRHNIFTSLTTRLTDRPSRPFTLQNLLQCRKLEEKHYRLCFGGGSKKSIVFFLFVQNNCPRFLWGFFWFIFNVNFRFSYLHNFHFFALPSMAVVSVLRISQISGGALLSFAFESDELAQKSTIDLHFSREYGGQKIIFH